MNIVTILGNTNSGAGAIYEYLIGRDDTNDPFDKREFRILNDPGGINDLYKCYESYSLQSFNDSFERLIKLEKLYRCKRNYFRDGLGLNNFKNYKFLWNDYIQSIRGKEYHHRYIYSDIQKNIGIQFFKRIINRIGYRKILFKKYYTGVTKREFRDKTYEFMMNLILRERSDTKFNILNQCGNFASPITSTELIGEPKIICVRRNPLDQYAELKIHKGMKSPKKFINWYLHLKRMEARDQFLDDRVLEINFEDFVLNYETLVLKISKFLDIDHKTISTYSPHMSKKNIGKYKRFLNKDEVVIIRKELSDWIHI